MAQTWIQHQLLIDTDIVWGFDRREAIAEALFPDMDAYDLEPWTAPCGQSRSLAVPFESPLTPEDLETLKVKLEEFRQSRGPEDAFTLIGLRWRTVLNLVETKNL